MKNVMKYEVVLEGEKVLDLYVNNDADFVRTPKKGKLFLIVDNTKKSNKRKKQADLASDERDNKESAS